MDADGLPLVGPGIDYTKVESISQKHLIAFVNSFVTNTAGFLNRFSCVCEKKLENLSQRMQQLEVTMNLLDAKIGSIPGLENVTAASSSGAASDGAPAADSGAPAAPPASNTAQAPPPPGGEVDAPPPPAPVEEAKPANPVSKDHRYAKFFKMVQFGVPEPAVKTKMALEGLNPDYLDTPDAPAPEGGQSNNADDDFSNSDSEASEEDSDFD